MMGSSNKSYVESIREKVATAIVIKKNALKKNIDYTTAKIMYNGGLNDIDLETAKKLAEEIKSKNIPKGLINIPNLIIRSGIYDSEYNLCIEIARYINRKHIRELSPYLFTDYFYGKAILNVMRKGVSLEAAVAMFELKVKYEMTTSHLTEIAALAKILWYGNNIAAKSFASEYQKGKAVVDKPFVTVINNITQNGEYKVKVIKGIRICSQTESGLQKLEKLIQEIIEKGNKKFVEVLLTETIKAPLMVCDFDIGESKTSNYRSAYHCIYIAKNDMGKGEEITNRLRLTFYHEVTHYLDYVKGNVKERKYYSVENPIVGKTFEKIKSMVNPLKRGTNLSYLMNKNAKKYVNNLALNQKWEQEIREKCPNISDKDFKLLMQHKRLEERKLFKEFAGYIIDIYDAMVKGKLYTIYLAGGHGIKYYSNPENVLKEFFANIGMLYDSGKVDILYYEFGEELAQELIAICNNFFGYSEKEKSSNKKM